MENQKNKMKTSQSSKMAQTSKQKNQRPQKNNHTDTQTIPQKNTANFQWLTLTFNLQFVFGLFVCAFPLLVSPNVTTTTKPSKKMESWQHFFHSFVFMNTSRNWMGVYSVLFYTMTKKTSSKSVINQMITSGESLSVFLHRVICIRCFYFV